LSPHRRLELAKHLQQQGSWLAAAAAYAELAALVPSDHRFLANQANALWLADLPEAAHRCYRRALTLQPDCAISRRGLASCLRDLNQFDEALELHRLLAHQIPLASADGQANLWAHSQVLMGLERYGEAFALMASRTAAPQSLMDDLLLVSEQGFGDSLQFVRFLSDLVRRRMAAGLKGGVELLIEPALVTLFIEGLAWLGDPPRILPKPPAASRPSQGLSLLELPHALGGDQALPSGLGKGYLRSPLWSATPRWLPRPSSPTGLPTESPKGSGPAIGLVSAAGRKLDDPFCAREYQKRTLPERELWRLVEGLKQQGALVYDLQFGSDQARHRALALELLDPGLSLEGFATTARVLAQLDLVITVDTAMAHLVGAMGRPGWVLLPWSADPRWLGATSTTPWYPSLRLFRQGRGGDWNGAVDQLLAAFRDAFPPYGHR
jgi:hypothetical protein